MNSTTDSEISDVESINNYEEELEDEDETKLTKQEEQLEDEIKLTKQEEQLEDEEDEENEEELEDYETDIDSNEPYSEYSDSEEDSDIEQLGDSLFDTGINESESSETEDSEMNEDKILKEISYYQNTTHNLIPRESFKRLCCEVLQDFVADTSISKNAIDAMHVACEAYMIEIFQKSNEISILGKRKTIQPKDMNFAKRNRTEY